MEDQIKTRIQELMAQRDQLFGQVQQNAQQRQQLETANQNGQAVEEELVEA